MTPVRLTVGTTVDSNVGISVHNRVGRGVCFIFGTSVVDVIGLEMGVGWVLMLVLYFVWESSGYPLN